jgi:hypothetical protein
VTSDLKNYVLAHSLTKISGSFLFAFWNAAPDVGNADLSEPRQATRALLCRISDMSSTGYSMIWLWLHLLDRLDMLPGRALLSVHGSTFLIAWRAAHQAAV